MAPPSAEEAAGPTGRSAEASPLAALWVALQRLPPADRVGAMIVGATSLAFEIAAYDRGLGPPEEGLHVATAAAIARGAVLYRDLAVPLPPLGVHLLAGVFWVLGATLPVARVAAALAVTLLALAVYRLLRGVISPTAATAGTLLLLGMHPWSLTPGHAVSDGVFAALPATLALAVLGGGLPELAAERIAVSGLLAGLSVLAVPHAGAAAVAALAAVVLLSPPAIGWVRGTGTLIAAASAPLVPAVLFFTSQRGLAHLWTLGVAAPFAAAAAQGAVIPAGLLLVAIWAAAVVMAARPHLNGGGRAVPLLLLLAATSILFATAAPRGDPHLLACLAPTTLLLVVLASHVLQALPSAARLLGGGVAWLAVGLVLASAASLVGDLRRDTGYEVHLPGGRIGLPADEALVITDLADFVARALPPDAPLRVFPPHPLLPFLLGREAASEPVRADPERDARLVADLERSGTPMVVYAFSPSATPLASAAPDLAAYLVEHYGMTRIFTASTHGLLLAAFVRLPPPPPPSKGSYVFQDHLDVAVLNVTEPEGDAYTVTGTERAARLAQDVWPLRRVISVQPTRAPGTTALHFVVRVPSDARLHVVYGMNPDRWLDPAPSALTFTITLRGADGTVGTLAETRLDPQRNLLDRGWRTLDAELAAYAGHTVDLAFAVSSENEAGERPDLAGFADGRIDASQ